jgi:5-methylcytosine-specific restriction endonuclease McrA
MTSPKSANSKSNSQIVAEAQRDRSKREQGYREQALRLFAPICARCGRDFAGKRMRELTVHHKDHNHHNNPSDGSNWEMLCLYCHDNEHSRYLDAQWSVPPTAGEQRKSTLTHSPFAGLADLLLDKKDKA